MPEDHEGRKSFRHGAERRPARDQAGNRHPDIRALTFSPPPLAMSGSPLTPAQSDAVLNALLARYFELLRQEDFQNPALTAEADELEAAIRERKSGKKT